MAAREPAVVATLGQMSTLKSWPGLPDAENSYLGEHASLLIASFHRWTGSHLVPPGPPDRARYRDLYHADFGLVSHNTDPDPLFNYANVKAQELFESSWHQFIGLPSRLSAEPARQADRERLMMAVSRDGFVSGYSGVRVSSSGRRFLIEDTIIWNLIDEQGIYRGQAAVFYSWTLL